MNEGTRYNCPQCGNSFLLRWRKTQRDYIFINVADLGKGEPLNLPRGSVRAIVTLTISLSIWAMLLFNVDTPHYLLNLALVMVGYYFAFRVDPAPLKGLPPIVEKGTKEPLYMPKGVIRWILIAGFSLAGLVVLLKGNLWKFDLVEFFSIMAGLTLGYISRKVAIEKLKFESPMWLKNTKSITVIVLALLLGVSFLAGFADQMSPILIRGSIVVIGFYFGSRN